jgi:glycosyltransferase involved in cell wall biosynthesis
MRVSAIIAVYNGAGRLAAAIDSVLAQEYAAAETIIVDDGSTDATADVIGRSGDRVRAFRQAHAGLSAAHNLALAHATGDAIAFLDHDDLWPPGRLAAMVDMLRSDETIDIVAGRVEVAFDGEVDAAAAPRSARYAPAFRPWSVQSLLIRRRVFDRIGVFDTELTHGMDIDWYMRAREHGVRYATVPETALIFRMHEGNMTRNVDATFDGILGAFKISLDRRRRTT